MATTVEPSIHYQNLDAESIRMVGSVQETFSDFSIYSRGKQIVSKTTQKTHHQRCSSLHSLQTSSSLEHSFWAHKSWPPLFWHGENPQVWEIWWLGNLCVVPTLQSFRTASAWSSQKTSCISHEVQKYDDTKTESSSDHAIFGTLRFFSTSFKIFT